MSTELEKQMRDGGQERRMLEFKHAVSLSDFTKLMGHYRKIHKICTGKDATYNDFTTFLEREGYVK